MRAGQCRSHQFQRPINEITAGTTSARMTGASSSGSTFDMELLAIHPEDATDVVEHAELRLGDGRLMAGTPREEGLHQAVGGASMYWVIDDDARIDEIHARAVATGAESVFAPHDADYGGRHCSLRDPDGHVWSFGTYRGQG